MGGRAKPPPAVARIATLRFARHTAPKRGALYGKFESTYLFRVGSFGFNTWYDPRPKYHDASSERLFDNCVPIFKRNSSVRSETAGGVNIENGDPKNTASQENG